MLRLSRFTLFALLDNFKCEQKDVVRVSMDPIPYHGELLKVQARWCLLRFKALLGHGAEQMECLNLTKN